MLGVPSTKKKLATLFVFRAIAAASYAAKPLSNKMKTNSDREQGRTLNSGTHSDRRAESRPGNRLNAEAN